MPTQKELLAKLALLDGKQDVLTAGNGINIDQLTDTITGQTFTQTYTPISPATGFKIGEITSPNGATSDVKIPNPEVVELTQAQYNALPATKGWDGVAYFVTDVPDIKIWLGTYDQYIALPLADRRKDYILYFIIPANAQEDETVTPQEEEEEEE